jgi:hypothetical protein
VNETIVYSWQEHSPPVKTLEIGLKSLNIYNSTSRNFLGKMHKNYYNSNKKLWNLNV